MRPVDQITSCKIANASVFAMMMIVGIHTLGCGRQSLEKGSALWWFAAFLQYGLFSIAVPFFFTCSGYFLAGHMDENGWWLRESKKRIWTLVVPYIVWGFLFALLSIAMDAFAIRHLPTYCRSFQFWIDAFGLSPISHPSLGPLWYIRALVLFLAISPIVKMAISKGGGVCISTCIYTCRLSASNR